ncbi:fimbrial protein [Segatella paludivivens]|uniref:fimbrial protein n=2 Tax=Segatella paludivivens TaxID=185294 RepID=UPI001F0A491F|nr:fimbrial protein [Segatella paludivivens]
MRIKTIMTACLAVPALSVLCLMSSCSSEELPTTEKPSTGPQTLTLNLKAAGTRAAVYTDPGTTAENTINIVTIGIFDQTADGTGNYPVKTIQEVTTSSTSPSITTSQLVAGDKVLVAVNAKAGTFTGAKNLTEFENKTLAIDDALASSNGSATTVASSNLPMFGTGTIAGSSTTFTAAVDVYHMVSKITLRTLNVNFLATGAYSAAKFTPTAVFLSNVPAALDFYPANTMTSYSTFASAGTLQQGESGVSSNLKSYLGTASPIGFTPVNATLSGVTTGSTYNWGTVSPSVANILYLYTMPSSAATSTRLVIRGDFDPDGTGANKVQVYYPVNINYNSSGSTIPDGGTVAKQIYPNKNYIIDVTIQGKGSSSPTVAIDPQTATANITVKDFTSANQSNVFN